MIGPTLFRQGSYEQEFESQYSYQNVDMDVLLIPPIMKRGITKMKKPMLSPLMSSSQTIPKRDYRKNICRNILRHAIKGMLSSGNCRHHLEVMLAHDTLAITAFTQYYNKHLE